MELRHLKYFVVVAESGSFSAAADRLGLAQPPLGRQMRDLEVSLGVTLFDRSSRGVTLTVAGETLLLRARELLRDADAAREEARSAAGGGRGRIAIGFSDEFAYGLLPRVAATFLATHPAVQLSLEMDFSGPIADAVQEGRYDIGMIVAPAPSHLGALVVRPVDRLRLHVALPLRHPLAARDTLALRDIAGETLITSRFMPTSGYFVQLMGLMRATGINPRMLAGVYPAEMIGHLVGAGRGVAIVCPEALSPHRTDLALVPLSDEEGFLERCVVWRADPPNALSKQFVDAIAPGRSVR